MGAADLVPGVSGGTIALLMGFYQTLIRSILTLFSKVVEERVKAVYFLAPLGMGVLASFFFLARAIDFCLQDLTLRPVLFSVFLGAIGVSTFLCLGKVKKNTIFKSLFFLLITAFSLACSLKGGQLFKKETYSVPYALQAPLDRAVNYNAPRKMLLGLNRQQVAFMLEREKLSKDAFIKEEASGRFVRAAHFAKPFAWFDLALIVMGVLSASAMLLPGISGSTLLMAVGLYPLLISALSDLSKGQIEIFSLTVLANFSIGAIGGVLLFSRVVRYLFERWHDYVILAGAAVIVGTLPIIWPFWHLKQIVDPVRLSKGLIVQSESLYLPEFNALSFLCFGLMALSALAVYFLSKIESLSAKRADSYKTSSSVSP